TERNANRRSTADGSSGCAQARPVSLLEGRPLSRPLIWDGTASFHPAKALAYPRSKSRPRLLRVTRSRQSENTSTAQSHRVAGQAPDREHSAPPPYFGSTLPERTFC